MFDALRRAALAAVDPTEAVLRALRVHGGTLAVGDETLSLDGVSRILLAGAGKAAGGMADGAIRALGDRVTAGVIVVPDGLAMPLQRIDVWEASHPVPDVRGLAAAAEALNLARSADPLDLLICLVSGGASALWSAPADGVELADLRAITRALLHAGAAIDEVNTVRRHLSRIAGGGLARAAAPARTITLALSDVIGGAPESIGSGPAVVDPSTFTDALDVLSAHDIAAPVSVRRHLQAGAAGDRPETLKPGELRMDPSFHLVGSVRDALAAAAEEAVRLGYRPTVVSDSLQGPAALAGEEVARAALSARDTGSRQILLWGGETTVVVSGTGRGGRNQEVALAAARVLHGHAGVTIATFATDGVDGPTPAAGAIIDADTVSLGRDAGFDPDIALLENDSHSFLRAAGALISTGPTGTNVNDLTVAIID